MYSRQKFNCQGLWIQHVACAIWPLNTYSAGRAFIYDSGVTLLSRYSARRPSRKMTHKEPMPTERKVFFLPIMSSLPFILRCPTAHSTISFHLAKFYWLFLRTLLIPSPLVCAPSRLKIIGSNGINCGRTLAMNLVLVLSNKDCPTDYWIDAAANNHSLSLQSKLTELNSFISLD